jgi:pilus assembly protein CpaB
MKPKTLILMVVAVTCGLGASYMTSRLLAERQTDDAEKVTILVAKKNLDMGLTIKKVEDFFEEKKFIRGDEPKSAIVDPKDLQGRVLKVPRRAGDFVTGEDLLSDKDVGLSALMAQGYRAMGIRMNIQDIASGFASLPMSRVDLLWTMQRANDKDSAARVLLENVLVLAADQNTTSQNGNNGAMPATVVTVLLKPEDCLKVAMAREKGQISLVLRKFNDHQKAEITAVTMEELVTNSAGKRDIEEGSWVEETQQPAIAKVDLPTLPKEAESLDVAAPKGTLHRLRLIAGEKERVVEYWLNENGEVIHDSVVRSEITPPTPPAPPRPPQVQPRPAQPQPPVAPPEEPKTTTSNDNE